MCAAVAVAGVVYATQTGSDDPQDVCAEQFEEHRDEVFTGPASDEQIGDLCRELLR